MTTITTNQELLGRVPSPPLNYDYSVITSDTDPAATLLLDAKTEYNKQLISHLRQPIFNLMKNIYNSSENICHQENTPENVLMVFQDNLAQIPKWSKTRRNKEYDEFLKISKCDWFNELIKFTYITHVKILTIVNKPRPDVKISISIPSGGIFYHSVCVSVARELWRQPFLFNKNVGGKYEYQKNMRQIEQIIDNSVDACIRAHIPMKAILQEYLASDVSSETTQISNATQNATADNPKEALAQSDNPKEALAQSDNPKEASQPDNPKEAPANNPADTTARIKKVIAIKNSDELDSFINSEKDSGNIIDGDLEQIHFGKPDETEDELEIIEPLIDDEINNPISNPHRPIDLLNEDTELSQLSEVILEPKQSSESQIEIGDEKNANQDNYETPITTSGQKNNNDEFNLDALPEIRLEDITKIAESNKPSIPETTTSISSAKNNNESNITYTVDTMPNIPISEMNEPGQTILQNSELIQPVPKKKVIVEDLGIDDLDEVSLDSKLEELRTFKNQIPDNSNKPKTNIITTKKEFAFF